MSKVKFFQEYVKFQGQGHEVKIFDMDRKVLPQGISMLNLKALSLSFQRLMPRLCFFQK